MSTNTEVTGILRLKGGNEFVRNMNSKLGQVKKQFMNLNSLVASAGITLMARKMMKAADDQELSVAKLRQTLISTKYASGMTTAGLVKLSKGLQDTGVYSDEAVMRAQDLVLTFTKIGKDIFPDVTRVIADMNAVMEKNGETQADMKEKAIQVGKAINDPIRGVSALTDVGVSFTEQQKEEIKALAESGDLLKAQKLILTELQTEFGGMNKALKNTRAGGMMGFKNDLQDILSLGGDLIYIVLGPIMSILQPLANWFKTASVETRNFVGAITAAGIALKILHVILATTQLALGPIGWLMLGITAVAGAFGLFNAATDKAAINLQKFNDELQGMEAAEAEKKLAGMRKELKQLQEDTAGMAPKSWGMKKNQEQQADLNNRITATEEYLAKLAELRKNAAQEEVNTESDNARTLRENRLQYEFETGQLSLAAYVAHLESKKSALEKWSDEWLSFQREIDELLADQKEKAQKEQEEKEKVRLQKEKTALQKQAEAQLKAQLDAANMLQAELEKKRAMVMDFVGMIQGIASQIGEALVQGFQGNMDGWKNVLKNILISVIDMLERYLVLAKIKALIDTIINPFAALKQAAPLIAAMAGLEAVKGAIYAMADGTVVTRPTLALVGEAGPEIVAPKSDFLSYSRQLMEEAAAGRGGGGVTSNNQNLTMNFNSPLTDRRQARRLTDNVLRPSMRRDAKRAGRLGGDKR